MGQTESKLLFKPNKQLIQVDKNALDRRTKKLPIDHNKQIQIDWDTSLKPMECMEISEQLSILKKLKKLSSKMLTENDSTVLTLDKSKLKEFVLKFENWIELVSKLGFEDDAENTNKLICSNPNISIINDCNKCIDNRISSILNTISRNQSIDNTLSDSSSSFDIFFKDKTTENKQNESVDSNQLLYEQYINLHGKPKRCEQFMIWAKQNGTTITFLQAKHLIQSNDHTAFDIHKTNVNIKKENILQSTDDSAYISEKKKK
eukprot:169110_1